MVVHGKECTFRYSGCVIFLTLGENNLVDLISFILSPWRLDLSKHEFAVSQDTPPPLVAMQWFLEGFGFQEIIASFGNYMIGFNTG